MIKSIIKLIQFLIVAGVIVVVLLGAYSQPTNPFIKMTPFDTHSYVQDRIAWIDQIALTNAPYSMAQGAYDRACDEIKTEHFVGTLSKAEYHFYMKSATQRITPIFIDDAATSVDPQQNAWSEAELNKIRSKAKSLYNIAPDSNLQTLINTVDTYFTAKTLIASASGCTTYAAAQAKAAQATKLKTATLPGNVRNDLNNVEPIALHAALNHTKTKCQQLIQTANKYDFAQFKNALTPLQTEAKNYKDNNLDQLIKQLNEILKCKWDGKPVLPF